MKQAFALKFRLLSIQFTSEAIRKWSEDDCFDSQSGGGPQEETPSAATRGLD
jgi:hypothetical protein